MDTKKHWEDVYQSKATDEVSWYQSNPATSLSLIEAAGLEKHQPIIDVGGGASNLVDHLLADGYSNLSVLDISATAIEAAKKRLGQKAGQISWYEADVTRFHPPVKFSLWHDRAVFHFLTREEDRQAYVENLSNSLSGHGQVIIATFSLNGPKQCSGLDIVQYDEDKIAAVLGERFELHNTVSEVHMTPARKEQAFSYFCFRKQAN